MYKNKQLSFLLGILIMCIIISCAEKDPIIEQTQIQLVAVHEAALTRSVNDIQATSFDGEEEINVYMQVSGASDHSEQVGNQPSYLFKTQSADENGINQLYLPNNAKLFYPPGNNVKLNVQAYYPKDITSNTSSLFVLTDQTQNMDNDAAKYKQQDVMFASVSNYPKSSQAIHLQFSHKMAKLIVNVRLNETSGITINAIKLKNFLTEAIFNSATGNLTATGSKNDITIANESQALIPPQTITSDFITVETNKGNAIFYIDSKEFEAGHQYIVNLGVGLTNVSQYGAVSIQNWSKAAGTLTVAELGNTGFAFAGTVAETYYYDGQEKKPELSVKDGENELTEHQDYELEYFNNINAGTALIVANGKGSKYEGYTAVQAFEIKKATINLEYLQSIIYAEYESGKEVQNELLNKGDATVSITSSDEDVAIIQDGKIIITGGGLTTITAETNDKNYEHTSTSFTLNVTPTSSSTNLRLEFADNETPSYTYDETNGVAIARTPEVVLYDGTNVVPQGEYSIVYSSPGNTSKACNAGEARVTVTGVGKRYSTSVVLYKTFNIAQATNTLTVDATTPGDGIHVGYDVNKTDQIIAHSRFGSPTFAISSGYSTAYADVNSSTGVVTGKGATAGTTRVTVSVPSSSNYTTPTPVNVDVYVEKLYFQWTYTGDFQTWTLPADAYYTFELRGGSGGWDGGYGAQGGLIKARKWLSKNTVVYIAVGGGGTGSAGAGALLGGWNGGGHSGLTGSSGSGGGATDIRIGGKACGSSVSYESNYPYLNDNNGGNPEKNASIDNRVLVAGGGGGASNGSGHGLAGGAEGSGKTASFNAPKWKGTNKRTKPNPQSTSCDGGGGGGGYYGGNEGNDGGTGATGGSNYVPNDWTLLTGTRDTDEPTTVYSSASADYQQTGATSIEHTYDGVLSFPGEASCTISYKITN